MWSTEVRDVFTIEFLFIVRHNFLWKVKMIHDILDDNVPCFFRFYRVHWFRLSPFGEIIYSDNRVLHHASPCWERAYEVNTLDGKQTGASHDSDLGCWSSRNFFVSLALLTFSDIIHIVFGNGGPEVSLTKDLYWETRLGGVVTTEAFIDLMDDGVDLISGYAPKVGYTQSLAVKLSIHNHVAKSLILQLSCCSFIDI